MLPCQFAYGIYMFVYYMLKEYCTSTQEFAMKVHILTMSVNRDYRVLGNVFFTGMSNNIKGHQWVFF